MSDVVETLEIGDTLATASDLLHSSGIRHLPVVDGQERVVGLVSHSDVLAAWVSRGRPGKEERRVVAAEVPIEEIMQTNVVTVAPDSPAAEAARIIEARKIGCLPVVGRGKLVGIITEADFVRFAYRRLDDDDIGDSGKRRLGT